MRRIHALLAVVGLGFGSVVPSVLHAEVKLPSIFSDHMVLQADSKITVWGKANPGESVEVSILSSKASTKAGEDGKWKLTLPAVKSTEPTTMTVKGENTLEIKDVLVGEVWLCSGQSNMQWTVNASKNPQGEAKAANYPQIRHFMVQRVAKDQPQDDIPPGKWEVCSPETVGNFTAVGYYFARQLHQDMNVPVGIIHSSWGGTPVESWIDIPSFDALPDLKAYYQGYKKNVEIFPQKKAEYEKALADWNEKYGKLTPAELKVALAGTTTQPAIPQKPKIPAGPDQNWGAANLYNAMIHPVRGYPIKGALWYQGESNANAGRAKFYKGNLSTLIKGWRNAWSEFNPENKEAGDFSFFIVQLANYLGGPKDPGPASHWAVVREAMEDVTKEVPKTGLATAIDIGEVKDIHPKNKQDVGKRLALVAEATTYGKSVQYKGPEFDSLKIEGDKAIVSFKNAEGLKAKGDKIPGFIISGGDGKWVDAEAKIEGNTVVLTSPEVKEPKAVRYGWADSPECTLYNGADLPALPFRSDR